MSDFNSSLPVRTENNGDVVVKLVDGTTNTQYAKIDANGNLYIASLGPASPGTAASFSDLAGGIYNSSAPTLTNGQQASLQLTAAGALIVTNGNFPSLVDTDYGVVGANTIRTAAQIGNATGAADFDAGATGAQTLRVVANQGAPNTAANGWFTKITDGTNTASVSGAGNLNVTVATALPAGSNNIGSVNQGTSPWVVSGTVAVTQSTSPWVTSDTSDGSVSGGTAGTTSMLAGGIHNSSPITLTNGQQAALQTDVNGRLLVATVSADDHNYGTVGANTLRTAAQIGNATGAADFDFGAVGAQTLRVASQIGNATGAADFNNGATGAQTLRVAANLAVAGAAVSTSNPIPVVVTSTVPGTAVENYKDATAIAAAGTDNHDYTVTAGKTLNLARIWASASGKLKIEVQIESGVGTGTFATKFVGFNSTATPNIDITVYSPIQVAAGVRVRIITTNKDNQAQDLYSTIEGTEV